MDTIGDLFIADNANNRIRKVDTNGIITTVGSAATEAGVYSGDNILSATDATLNFPEGASIDSRGNLFIADTGNSRIREVAYSGNPTLTLNNVTTSNAGTYSVVVTNPYGSTNSSNATLAIQTPPAPRRR